MLHSAQAWLPVAQTEAMPQGTPPAAMPDHKASMFQPALAGETAALARRMGVEEMVPKPSTRRPLPPRVRAVLSPLKPGPAVARAAWETSVAEEEPPL